MKARFLTSLQVKRIERALDAVTPSEGFWVLTAPLIYDSEVLDRRITVPDGFRTDFASVPRLPLVYLLYGGDVGDAAAVVHDFLYTAGAVPREKCDAVFKEALAVLGVAGWRRWPMWAGVRLFGGSHYSPPSR